ncbi:MAG: histidine kinase, partial [bacterium]|nr:histidine kinase [bacterium]
MQMWPQQYYFRNYNEEDGLSQLIVWSLFQDRDGYIWVGTEAGLNRFDGNSFQIFSIRQGLFNDYINDITQDSAGRIWVGTRGGISRWDGKVFVNYTVSDGLPDNYVLSLAADQTGRLWCGTAKGLSRWDGSTFYNFTETHHLPQIWINALFVDNRNRLWVGTEQGLFYQEGERFIHSPGKNLGKQSINGITGDAEYDLWVASNESVYRFRGTRQVARYTAAGELPFLGLFSIFGGRDGSVWIGSRNGLFRAYHGEIQNIKAPNDSLAEDISDILEDHEGIIWIGHSRGAAKMPGRAFTNYNTRDGLGSKRVRPIIRDRKGILWAGTTGGLGKFDGKTWSNITAKENPSFNDITCLFEDSRDTLWVGTHGGLRYFDGQQFHNEGFLGHRIYSIAEDNDGRLWIAIRGKGILRSGIGGYQTIEIPGQRFFDGRLLKDSNGNIWVSGDNGLSVWNGLTWKTWTKNDGLASNDTYFMCQDYQGRIWFGYNSSQGITCYDAAQSTFRTYTTADGLYNDAVYSIGEDRDHNLWIGTARGVDKFDGKTFINYGKGEGYADNESMAGGFFADHDGTLWFGTADGLSHYDPRNDLSFNQPPSIKIKDLSLGDQPIAVGSHPIVPHSRNVLRVSVACLSYIDKKRISLRYRLKGYGERWNSLRNYEITYTNLPPGDYMLEVQGRKYQYDWSAPVVAGFTIKAPFWQTGWFYGLCILSVVFLVIGMVRIRVRQLKKRELHLERLVDERTRQLREANEIARQERLIAEAAKENAQKERLIAEKANQAKSEFLANMSH